MSLALPASAYRGVSLRKLHGSSNTVNTNLCNALHPSSERKTTKLYAGEPLDDRTKEKIETVISDNKVVLFMKGNKIFPQCGFSNTACRILDALETPYTTVNVLDDDNIRNGIKIFSSWPTIPQLYVQGDFVGGSDIMIEMYENGELAEMIELANAN